MKSNTHNTRITLVLAFFATISLNISSAFAQKDRIATTEPPKSGDQAIAELLAQPTYYPLPGQIPIGLADVSEVSAVLTVISNAVQPGDQGQASPWFAKLQSVRTGLSQLVTSKLQTHLFALVPGMADFFAAEGAGEPAFVHQVASSLHSLSVPILRSFSQHVIEQNATIVTGNLTAFIEIFGTDGFVSESNWEEEQIPVDAAGVMILDASAVVASLKTKPWQQAERFLGGETSAQAFSRYAVSGNGLVPLKTKYAANQAAIIVKWNELVDWVVKQRAANP